jgi:hypothetical protein
MGPTTRAGAAPERTNEPGFDRRAAVTRSLLGYGVLVGPFYLAVGLLQALLREGFDLKRHPLSVLANGPGGWVQTANFVLSGLMVLAAVVGFGRVLGPKSRGVRWSLGIFGASMLVAAIFRADPMDGFPVGTPAGSPTTISTVGFVHFVAGTLGFTALAVSCFFAASVMSRRNTPSLARLSFLSGLAVLIGFYGGAAFSNNSAGVLGIWLSVVVGWAWLAVMSRHLYRVAPDPNCASRPR